MKQCSRCNTEKEPTEFYKAKGTRDGLQLWCKKCDNDRHLPYSRARQRRLGKEERVPQRLAEELRAKGLKRCPRCKEIKALTSFYESGDCNGGYATHCILCVNLMDGGVKKASDKRRYQRDKDKRRDKLLQSKYGITLEDYNRRLAEQGGGCAVCGGTDKGKCLAVDHAHDTGRIRGLLCGRCNPAVGYLKDSADLARKVADYLDKHKEAVGD